MKSQKSIQLILLSLVLSIVTALALIGLTGCTIIIGEVPEPEEPPAEQPPEEGPPDEVLITFTADRTHLQPGECAMLEWSVQGGFGVELNGQPVEKSGQKQVCPEETIPYRLGVDTGETMEEREVMIFVEGVGEPPPPEEHPPEEPPPEEPPPPDEPDTWVIEPGETEITWPDDITVVVPPIETTEIPEYILWVVVAVGAILVIAVVVLIVRTRRVA